MGKEGNRSNARRDAARLAVKIFVFALPLAAAIGLYISDDPFMVLRDYSIYDSDIILDENYVGWKIYRSRKDSAGFNSFILGNSCTLAYRCGEWEKHLPEGSRAVRLFGNGEPVKAIQLKLEALERDGTEISNVLMILDRASLEKTGLYREYINLLPPEVSGRPEAEIQSSFLQGFLMPDFLFPYLKYRITGRIPENGKYFNRHGRIRNPENNDCINPRDRMIEEEGESYWECRRYEFPVQNGKGTDAAKVLGPQQIQILESIRGLLQRNSTSYRLVISPDYNGIRLNPDDRKILEEIFGTDNVYDFSGNDMFTSDYHNYYEQHHYRPSVGTSIMEIIYKD